MGNPGADSRYLKDSAGDKNTRPRPFLLSTYQKMTDPHPLDFAHRYGWNAPRALIRRMLHHCQRLCGWEWIKGGTAGDSDAVRRARCVRVEYHGVLSMDCGIASSCTAVPARPESVGARCMYVSPLRMI
jgi:hypothetical protein